jgi:hypothetical protein
MGPWPGFFGLLVVAPQWKSQRVRGEPLRTVCVPSQSASERLLSCTQFDCCSTLRRTDCVQTPPGCKGRAVFSLGDDSRRALGCRCRRGSPSGSDCHCAIRNTTTTDCIFPLDTTRDWPQNPCNFSTSFLVQGSSVGKRVRRSSGCGLYLEPAEIEGGDLCSICRVGPCSVLIRNAWLVATGCVPAPPEANFVATVTPRSTMFRRRWALACGCDLAHSVVTVPRVVPPGVRGSRCSRANWARSSRPVPRRAVPARIPILVSAQRIEAAWLC